MPARNPPFSLCCFALGYVYICTFFRVYTYSTRVGLARSSVCVRSFVCLSGPSVCPSVLLSLSLRIAAAPVLSYRHSAAERAPALQTLEIHLSPFRPSYSCGSSIAPTCGLAYVWAAHACGISPTYILYLPLQSSLMRGLLWIVRSVVYCLFVLCITVFFGIYVGESFLATKALWKKIQNLSFRVCTWFFSPATCVLYHLQTRVGTYVCGCVHIASKRAVDIILSPAHTRFWVSVLALLLLSM